jgi:hypothetical protein
METVNEEKILIVSCVNKNDIILSTYKGVWKNNRNFIPKELSDAFKKSGRNACQWAVADEFGFIY